MSERRLFVAVWPPDDVIEDLRALHRKDQPGVRFVPEENWHVTLRFLGDASPDRVSGALGAVDFAPVEVHVGPVVDLLSDHSVVVAADGLADWRTRVVRATVGLGTAPVRRRFVGHITLARLGRSAKQRMHRVDLLGTPFSAKFVATEIALVESRLRPDGARYETLMTWPAARC